MNNLQSVSSIVALQIGIVMIAFSFQKDEKTKELFV